MARGCARRRTCSDVPVFQRLARHPRTGLAVAVAVGVLATFWLQNLPPPAQPLEATPVVRAILDDPGSPRAGAADPDVTIVVFTDYRCPICKATDPALDRRLAADPRVRVIFKDWPIRGAASEFAARTALAADRQGRYATLHTALMAARGPVDEARVDVIAADAGLDMARLRADRVTHAAAIDSQLARHAMQAFGLGLQGTPAYLVGPYLIQGGLDDRALADAVKRARRAG